MKNPLFTHTTVEPSLDGTRKRLVVLLHGYGFSSRKRELLALRATLRNLLPDADLLAPQYKAGMLSNADPADLAAQLDSLIEARLEARSASSATQPTYKAIILIGHSIGSLIIRKAFVFGMGSTEDHPIPLRIEPKPWTQMVERIVLLAGMNRGWTLSPRPKHMSIFRKLLLMLGLLLGRLTQTGRLFRRAQRGSPFVANLRIQWVRLAQSRVLLPPVIQLLGSRDDFVSHWDSSDVSCATNFIFIPVVDTGHSDIVTVTEDDRGERVRNALTRALTASIHSLSAGRDSGSTSIRAGNRKRQIRSVFILHGIRDLGLWRKGLRQAIASMDSLVGVNTPGYSYLPMIPFLLSGFRRRFVRMFVDLYTEELAAHPRVKVCAIGHSNGSYIVAQALQDYRALRLERIAFAGSVVPRDYPWDQVINNDHRVEKVRNYVASADWVVAIFPRLFELLKETFGITHSNFSELGTGGFNGFLANSANAEEVRFVKGGHSAALQPRNHSSIAGFICGRKEPAESDIIVEAPSVVVTMLSRFCWLVWALLVLAIAGLGSIITGALAGWLTVPLAIGWVAYVALMLALLYTL